MDYPIRTIHQLEPILKSFRKEKGLTQGEMAQKSGVSQQALSALESKPHRASFERLFAYLSALDVELVLREKKLESQADPREW
jgi:HTH-type transcriptional regulator/antitoxin HipB